MIIVWDSLGGVEPLDEDGPSLPLLPLLCERTLASSLRPSDAGEGLGGDWNTSRRPGQSKEASRSHGVRLLEIQDAIPSSLEARKGVVTPP